MRLLITGSRDWTDYARIEDELSKVVSAYISTGDFGPHTLVSGACPTGADRMCEEAWESFDAHADIPEEFFLELHPADWDKYGKRAGFIRNSEMVKLGADHCLAFIRNDSKGATMTARIAEAAHIPVTRVVVND